MPRKMQSKTTTKTLDGNETTHIEELEPVLEETIPNLYLEPVTETAIEPFKATDHAACYDIHADLFEREINTFNAFNENCAPVWLPDKMFILKSGERALIPTGWKMCCDPGWKIEIAPRSGNAIKKGLSLINCIGIIDSDYRDEVMLLMVNHSKWPVQINHGERIAQLSLEKVNEVDMVFGVLPETDSNRTGGMGSTDEEIGENK